jgi:hypothetical protein
MASVNVPIFGRMYDRDTEMLQFCKNAKPFMLASSWKLNFDTTVKVGAEPAVCSGDGKMNGANEIPPTNARSTGVASGGSLSLNMDPRDGIVTAVHIHVGKETENGPILFTISNGPAKEKAKLPDLPQSYAGADLYVNVHTDQYPNGAIRGNWCAP